MHSIINRVERIRGSLEEAGETESTWDENTKTFEDWVRRNVNVRECIKFIKKKDNKDDPICKCGNKRSAHIARTVELEGEKLKWDQATHTTLIENNAFGKINFPDVDTTTQPQYMRVAVDNGHADTIKKMERLFTEFWKLNEPDLLISVTGGAKSFNVSHDICVSFQQGLLSAAKSTNAWLITGGQNCGVMKLVGDVIGRSIFTSKICTIGVGNWGKTWRREMLLNKNRHPQAREPMVNYTLDDPAKGYAALDPNHTHHFLVDDGTAEKEGIEIEFRGELENLVCDMFTRDGVSLPMVCIMIEGGMQSIDQAVSTLKKGNTLVVLKGSGRASDIVCYGYEHSIEVEQIVDGEKKMIRTLSDFCRSEIEKLIDKDFSKYKAQGITEKMISAVLEISTYKQRVTVFSIYNPEPLDFYILSSLMQSSGNSATRMRQMRLAITWGHAKVAKEFIFSRKEYKFSSDELNSLLLFSIIKQRTAFVKLLIDYGANVKEFVTQGNLTRLYNELRTSTGGYRLLEEKRKKEKLDRGAKRLVSRRKNVKSMRGVMLSDVGQIMGQIMKNSHTHIFCDPKYNEKAQGDETFENPFDLMTMYSALADCQSMALLFWESCKTPMATGLVAHKIYMFLDKMEGKWARMDEEMTEKLENAAQAVKDFPDADISEFEMLSCGLMTTCYHNYDKSEWINILTVKMKDWGYLSLFDIANITNSKNFISHAAYQSHLTDIWMGNIHASTPTWKLLISIIPPLPIFLSFNARFTNKDGTMKRLDAMSDESVKFSGRERLELYYTSPVIKFFLNTITYLLFLALYTYSLLGSTANAKLLNTDNPTTTLIKWTDYYTLIFVVSNIPVECTQMVAGHTKSLKKKLINHFKTLYNLMDLLAVIMFMLAFMKKEQTIVDDNIFNLTEFGLYHEYRLLGSLCFCFYCFRFVQMFEINSQIGPKLFMLKRMSIDLFFFLFLLLVFTASYCVASEGLLYPFQENLSFVESLYLAFRRSYLNVFGDIDSAGMDDKLIAGHCTELALNVSYPEAVKNWTGSAFDTDKYKEQCGDIDQLKKTVVGRVNYYITFVLLCAYLLFVNIMLINLLIAIFSNTYADSEAKSGIIYKTQRAQVIIEFKGRPWLPNPLSLFYFLIQLSKFLLDKCVCKKKLHRSQIKRVNRQNASFNAFRASLIEAECISIFMRKKKAMKASTNHLIERLTLKVTGLENIVEKIEKQMKKKADTERHKLIKEMSVDTDEPQTKVKAIEAPPSKALAPFPTPPSTTSQDLPLHRYSRSNPYPKNCVTRCTVSDEQVPWKVLFEWYDPPEYTDEELVTNESESPEGIVFNEVGEGLDRVSYYKTYQVVDGDPLNPCGRTGLKGRGGFPLWGCNKYAVTIVTRWSRPGTGNVFSIKNKQVLEVLIVQNDPETNIFTLPKQLIKQDLPDYASHKKCVKEMCFNYENVSSIESENVDKMLDETFSSPTPIYKGYFDSMYNTDNSWMEVDVYSIHLEGVFSTTQPMKAASSVEAKWCMLDKKALLRNNDAWLLKKTCNKLQAYNPYRGEALL